MQEITELIPLDEDKTYVRSYHFVMPFTQIRPQQLGRALGGGDRTNIAGHIWVPVDDENCMVYNWMYSYGEEGLSEKRMFGGLAFLINGNMSVSASSQGGCCCVSIPMRRTRCSTSRTRSRS